MIEQIVNELASRPTNNISVNNFYRGNDTETQKRLNNIATYLAYYEKNPPEYILIGEAPGHKGCAKSGIPFTSQYVISNADFFKSNFQLVGGKEKERTSTIMWDRFASLHQYPLLWNAFPFHPHKENSPSTNRLPNSHEIEEGLEYIKFLQIIFPKSAFVAVGNIADSSLNMIGIPVYDKVCHPAARNGKTRFDEKMNKILTK